MKYSVLEKIRLKTSKGEIELHPGQVTTLHNDIAIKLINECRISPIGKVSYKIYSKILDDVVWIVATDKELKELIEEGIKETIYTHKEVSRMLEEGVSREGLVAIQEIKKGFPGATVGKIEQAD